MKRTHCIAGIVLIVLGIYATLSLVTVMGDLNEAESATAELKAQLAQAQAENEKLKTDIESLGSDKSTEALAREKLGLVKADEIVFIDMK